MAVIVSKQIVVPVREKKASDYAVGEIVKLRFNGSPVPYIVVNQGVPEKSSLYDTSCDGTWVLPVEIVEKRRFHGSPVFYASSEINAYLNGDFLRKFGTAEQNAIKKVKIPHINTSGGVLTSGANGLLVSCFLLGNMEVGCVEEPASYIYKDGACLSYFAGINSKSANLKRVANFAGAPTMWFLRAPHLANYYAMTVLENGAVADRATTMELGIRPAHILRSDALFDGNNILKG